MQTPRAVGWRTDAARSASALSEEVRRRKALERELSKALADVDYWRSLALAQMRGLAA